MRTESEILSELKRRKAAGQLGADYSSPKADTVPLGDREIAAAEDRLGFRLPRLLRAIYGDISNGGFGESYGFLGLVGGPTNETGQDSVSLYESYRRADPGDEHWHWPEGLLPVCHLGCGMYHCVQCLDEALPVIWFEPNPHTEGEPWDESFIPFSTSLREYLSARLDGADLWAKLDAEA
jgi:hypothetical protein